MRKQAGIGWIVSAVVCAALGATSGVQGAGLITSVTDAGSDAAITDGVTSQRENDKDGVLVLFGEDVFCFTDRTAEWNGARYRSSDGALDTAGDTVVPLPSYLVGGEYVSTRNTNRDNADFRLNVTVSQDVWAYLLIDNRVGENPTASVNPPTLGSGGVGAMSWVADDGWVQVNTGLFPNGQPDFVGFDEGSTPSNWAGRVHGGSGLATGAGNGLNQFATVYKKFFTGGSTIVLKEQNDGTNDNMYGLVVTPEPGTIGLLIVATAGLASRRRRH